MLESTQCTKVPSAKCQSTGVIILMYRRYDRICQVYVRTTVHDVILGIQAFSSPRLRLRIRAADPV